MERISTLIETFTQQLDHAAKHRDEDAIHDLRVSIRRLSESLRVFHQFFPEDKVKRVRRRLRRLMDFAAVVRDRDIALQLLSGAGMPDGDLAALVRQERDAAERELRLEIRHWKRRDYPARWPQRLKLANP